MLSFLRRVRSSSPGGAFIRTDPEPDDPGKQAGAKSKREEAFRGRIPSQSLPTSTWDGPYDYSMNSKMSEKWLCATSTWPLGPLEVVQKSEGHDLLLLAPCALDFVGAPAPTGHFWPAWSVFSVLFGQRRPLVWPHWPKVSSTFKHLCFPCCPVFWHVLRSFLLFEWRSGRSGAERTKHPWCESHVAPWK